MSDVFDLAAPDQSLLVPLRLAADARLVGPAAVDIAQRLDIPVEIFTAISVDDELDETEERFLACARTHFGDRGISVGVGIEVWEQPAWAVVEYCSDRLVCMSTSASPFDARHFTGSYTASILARSTAPVFLVGPAASEHDFGPDLREIVVAVSPDHDAEPTWAASERLAERIGVDLRRVTVEPDSVGSVGAALATQCEDGLLVVATHARLGLDLIAAGSVLFDAVSVARRPVLAMGPNIGLEVAPSASGHPIDARRTMLD